jgi:hypothetical protein
MLNISYLFGNKLLNFEYIYYSNYYRYGTRL